MSRRASSTRAARLISGGRAKEIKRAITDQSTPQSRQARRFVLSVKTWVDAADFLPVRPNAARNARIDWLKDPDGVSRPVIVHEGRPLTEADVDEIKRAYFPRLRGTAEPRRALTCCDFYTNPIEVVGE